MNVLKAIRAISEEAVALLFPIDLVRADIARSQKVRHWRGVSNDTV